MFLRKLTLTTYNFICSESWKRFNISAAIPHAKEFAKCSVANNQCEEIIDDINETLQIILWNNKFICINGKPIFYKTLAEKGILRIGDLVSERKWVNN